MILNLAKHEAAGGIERGVYYFNLPDYPAISAEELKLAAAFIQYERANHRQTEIVCDDENVLNTIINVAANPEKAGEIILSETTKFVYHATGLSGAQKILSGGKLLSAAKVYHKTGEELALEKRESPWNDPPDFFEYVMFCNGDDMTGDYVVLSEHFPSANDLEKGNFNAGVRFYMRSDVITRHPGHVFDGYHPVKIKDEIILSEYLHACVVPEQYREELHKYCSPDIAPKVHYLPQMGLKLSEWNENVYDFINKL